MSFAGALGQGLLSAVAGGAGAYVDETKRQAVRDDAAADRERFLRLQDEIAAARARAVEEERRKRAVMDREDLAGRIKGYAGKAGGMLSDPATGETDDQYRSVASMDRAGENPDDLARREAIMAGDEEAHGLLSKLSDSEEKELKRQEIEAKIQKYKREASPEGNRPGYIPADGMYWDEELGKWVKNPKSATHVYQHGDGGSGGGKSKEDEAKTVKSYFTKTVQRLAGKGKGIKDVTEFDEVGYQTFANWLAATGREGNLSSYNAWVADGKRSSPGGNKQTLAKTSGNMPRINTKAEADRLPSGTRFIGPDGKVRVKP